MPPRHRTASRLVRLLALASVALGATACQLEQEWILALEEDAAAYDILIPPANFQTTALSGSLTARATLEISIWHLLFGLPLEGDFEVQEVAIAGAPIRIAPPFPLESGFCQSLDTEVAGSGRFEISLERREIALRAEVPTRVATIHPVAEMILGGEPFPVPITIDAAGDFTLYDLLRWLGGEAPPLSLVTPVFFELETDIRTIDGLTLEGDLPFRTVGEVPTGPDLDACAAFLAPPVMVTEPPPSSGGPAPGVGGAMPIP